MRDPGRPRRPVHVLQRQVAPAPTIPRRSSLSGGSKSTPTLPSPRRVQDRFNQLCDSESSVSGMAKPVNDGLPLLLAQTRRPR